MIRVELKDGTVLNCSVYGRDKIYKDPIINHETINNIFSGNNFINFKTDMVDGEFHPSNVVKYVIEHENEYSYLYPRADGYGRDWC